MHQHYQNILILQQEKKISHKLYIRQKCLKQHAVFVNKKEYFYFSIYFIFQY